MRTPNNNSYRYAPVTAPISASDFPLWAENEFRNIKGALDIIASGGKEKLYVAPLKPRDGDFAYADGSSWNPHSGGGMYLYISSGWGKVITSNSSGNVGIGTTSPSYRLHVSASASVVAMLETTASDNVQLRLKGVSGERWAIGNNVSTGGTGLNFDFYDLASNANRLRIDATGNVVVGSAALATNATGGFHWIPSCAGTPTGSPTAPYTNAAAMVVDTTNSKLYVRVGAAWKSVTLT